MKDPAPLSGAKALVSTPTDAELRAILTSTRRIAVVGASANPARPSHGVLRFLLDRGYDAVPVNPGLAGRLLHGRTVAASLAEAAPLDMVDLFRAPAHVLPVIRDAVRLRARTVWMQLGVMHEEAAAEARAAGLAVVMDRCPVIEWRRLGLDEADLGLAGEPCT